MRCCLADASFISDNETRPDEEHIIRREVHCVCT